MHLHALLQDGHTVWDIERLCEEVSLFFLLFLHLRGVVAKMATNTDRKARGRSRRVLPRRIVFVRFRRLLDLGGEVRGSGRSRQIGVWE